MITSFLMERICLMSIPTFENIIRHFLRKRAKTEEHENTEERGNIRKEKDDKNMR